MEPKLRLVVPASDDTMIECRMNKKSSRIRTASTWMKRIFRWLKSGRSDQRRIDSKSAPSWSSGTRSSPMGTTGCQPGGQKMLAKLEHRMVRWLRSLSFFTPNQMPSQKSPASGTVVQMAEYCTRRTPHAQSARSSRSNAESVGSCTVASIASRRALTCSELLGFPLSSFQPRQPMPEPDFSFVLPKELRSEPVYKTRTPIPESNFYPSTPAPAKKPVLTLVPKS